MKYVRDYPVCDGCKHSSLMHCNKFNEDCNSFFFHPNRYQIPCEACLLTEGFGYEYGLPEKKEPPTKFGYFHLPGPENLDIFESLLAFRTNYPDAFYENRIMLEVYGAFPGAIWNGRTPNFGGHAMTIQEIDVIRERIEKLGLSLNLTWNNHLVSGTDVYDRFCNSITKIFHNGKHSITVASPELYAYLKENYPNFKYYSSIIPTANDTEFIKRQEGYDFYFWPRNLNNNWEKMLAIPMEERGQLEFLVNDVCTPICKRLGHYNVVNKCLLERSDEKCLGGYCTVDHDFMKFNTRRWPISINTEDIDAYIDEGFCHYKIASRGDEPSLIALKVIEYLVKPQFRDDAFIWVTLRAINTEEDRARHEQKNK